MMVAAGKEAVRQRLQTFGPRADVQRRVQFVEDVVGVAGEAVQRVHGGALVRGEQPRGKEVGAAVFGGDLPAAAICRAQVHILDAGGVQFGADHRNRAFRSRVVVADGRRCR